MSANEIVFSAVKTNAKNNKLEQDKNGYYRVTLGAINALNHNGDAYLATGVKELIENSSNTLARRLKNGYLKGEAGHPVYETGMSKAEYFARNLRIDLTLVSHHIRDIILTPTDKHSGVGGIGNQILVEAWIKPSGPHGEALKAMLDDPDQNVAFSIRCFTKDEVVGGVNCKTIMQIITWDWVLEPGISLANKWDKLSLESLTDMSFNMHKLANDSLDLNQAVTISLESADQRDIAKELLTKYKSNENKYAFITKW